MLRDDLFQMLLRIGELAFAAVVAGITGEYLHAVHDNSDWSKGRFIYTEILAALSIILALLWLLPFSGTFIHWPVDLLLSIGWFISFGLLVNFIGPMDCGSIWNWGDITGGNTCQKFKADVAFAFLSAIFWLASALLGIWVMRRVRGVGRRPVAGETVTPGVRRPWYRSHRYRV